jgi:hypothetical protein
VVDAEDACFRAEEERRGNVAVRSSLGDLQRDLKFLRG